MGPLYHACCPQGSEINVGESLWSRKQGELVPSGHARAITATNSAPAVPCTGPAQGQANSSPSMVGGGACEALPLLRNYWLSKAAGGGRVMYLQVLLSCLRSREGLQTLSQGRC